MKTKIEITNPRLNRLAKETLDAGGKLELVSRSTGSGETVHSWIKADKTGFKWRSGITAKAVAYEISMLDATLKDWLDRACSKYDTETKALVTLALKDAPKTASGKNVFYIRSTTVD